jgi:hypothetical protein
MSVRKPTKILTRLTFSAMLPSTSHPNACSTSFKSRPIKCISRGLIGFDSNYRYLVVAGLPAVFWEIWEFRCCRSCAGVPGRRLENAASGSAIWRYYYDCWEEVRCNTLNVQRNFHDLFWLFIPSTLCSKEVKRSSMR